MGKVTRTQRIEAAHRIRDIRNSLVSYEHAIENLAGLPDITYEGAVTDIDNVIARLRAVKKVLAGEAMARSLTGRGD
jgi:hypothetical protein